MLQVAAWSWKWGSPGAFQKGPEDLVRVEQVLSAWSTPPGPPSLGWEVGDSPATHNLPPRNTSNALLPLHYSSASSPGCCRAPGPGAEEEKSRRAH